MRAGRGWYLDGLVWRYSGDLDEDYGLEDAWPQRPLKGPWWDLTDHPLNDEAAWTPEAIQKERARYQEGARDDEARLASRVYARIKARERPRSTTWLDREPA